MPYKDHIVKKVSFTIHEMADELGLADSKVRFWIKELRIKPKNKNDWNQRFSENDFEKIKFLHKLDNYLTMKGKSMYLKGKLKIELL